MDVRTYWVSSMFEPISRAGRGRLTSTRPGLKPRSDVRWAYRARRFKRCPVRSGPFTPQDKVGAFTAAAAQSWLSRLVATCASISSRC